MGPYAYKGNQWVSFDDKEMIRQKALLIRQLGLGGGMIWALDLDDFKDNCGEGAHPLLTELQSVLADPSNEMDQHPVVMQPTTEISPQNIDSAEIIEESLQNSEILETSQNSEEDTHQVSNSDLVSSSADSDYKVVCYFSEFKKLQTLLNCEFI